MVIPESMRRLMSAEDRKRYGCPTNEESAANYVAKTEKELQNKLMSMLYRRGHHPYRQRMDRKSNIDEGLPDIHFTIGGVSIYWEVKLPGKNPDERQTEKLAALAALPSGAIVKVVRTYQEGWNHYQQLAAKYLTQ